MSENLTLGCFAAALAVCVVTGWPVLYALAAGLLLFFFYGLAGHHSPEELCRAALSGIAEVRTVLFTLVLIGFLSALWRICGTIPFIVTCAGQLLQPGSLLVTAFLLCCLLSFLTGTSFGTAATAGVICMAMAKSMNVSSVLMGGAVLSGSYFGDRCSPVSTSALLISSLTETDLYTNLRIMFRTAFVPFLLSCMVYGLLGMSKNGGGTTQDLSGVFSGFLLKPALLLPAAAILLCSLFRLNVKWTMLLSILLSAFLAVVIQGVSLPVLLDAMILGFHPENAALSAVLSGGGLLSMAKVLCIVCISSAYSGLFQVTGLLKNLQRSISRLSKKISPYGSTLTATGCMSLIACNQTLTILLTWQLCKNPSPKSAALKERTALASCLEDSAVVIAPLVPWSIAAAVPLASICAPSSSILAACFLYFLPLWRMLKRK